MDPHSFRHAIVCCVLTLSWTSYVSYALATNELTCVEDAVPNCTALITRCEEFEEDVCSSVTTIKDVHAFSDDISINNTQRLQPAVTIVARGGVYNVSTLDRLSSVYIVGFRDCTSNANRTCYVLNKMQAVNDSWTDTIIPIMASGGELDDGLIPAGDECTFFGCYQLCLFNGPPTDCHSTREEFFEANFTSLGLCEIPDNFIANGKVTLNGTATQEDRYVEDTVIHVSCNDGYSASDGSKNITCYRNGSWDGIPICTRSCDNPGNSTSNGNVSSNGSLTEDGRYFQDTVITVTCEDGYSSTGSIICQHDGNWSLSELPRCIRSCLNPGYSIKNGNLSINVSITTDDDHYAEGTVITVTCEDGYRVSDGGVSTCQLDGTWSSSSEIPSCTKIQWDSTMLLLLILPTTFAGLLLFLLFWRLYKRYQNYRNDKNRMFSLVFKMKTKSEVINPNYEPVDVRPHKMLSISLSIKTLEEYTLTATTPLGSPGKESGPYLKAANSGSLATVFRPSQVASSLAKKTDQKSKSDPTLLTGADTAVPEVKETVSPLVEDDRLEHSNTVFSLTDPLFSVGYTAAELAIASESPTTITHPTARGSVGEPSTAITHSVSSDETNCKEMAVQVAAAVAIEQGTNKISLPSSREYPSLPASPLYVNNPECSHKAVQVYPVILDNEPNSITDHVSSPTDISVAFEKVDSAFHPPATVEATAHPVTTCTDDNSDTNTGYIESFTVDRFTPSSTGNRNDEKGGNFTSYLADSHTHSSTGSGYVYDTGSSSYIEGRSVDETFTNDTDMECRDGSVFSPSSSGYILERELRDAPSLYPQSNRVMQLSNQHPTMNQSPLIYPSREKPDLLEVGTGSSGYIFESHDVIGHSTSSTHELSNKESTPYQMASACEASMQKFRSNTPELRPLESGYVDIVS